MVFSCAPPLMSNAVAHDKYLADISVVAHAPELDHYVYKNVEYKENTES